MNADDRKLLELAAKAAGIYERVSWENSTNEPQLWDRDLRLVFRCGSDVLPARWNPLKDDGDALRLAVQLRIGISVDSFAIQDLADGDVPAATRRAIVRAAGALA